MTEYVAGFLFDLDFNRVALIKKVRPVWQYGKLNAIGGKIELGETPLAAMVREFKEETDMLVEDWYEYVVLSGEGFVVHFFYAITPSFIVRTMTDEVVDVYRVDGIPSLKTIPNLKWLIPMAMTMHEETAAAFTVQELRHAHN